jgi:hypothetical protein
MPQQVRRRSSWIASAPPSIWAYFYLATFVVFGCLYILVSYLNPHSFFQSTARFEPRYRDDERRVAQHLESDIRRVLALTVEADGQYGRYQPVVKDVSAHHLRVLPDQTIEFLVNVPIIDEELDGLRYDILFTVRGNLIHYDGELDLRVKDYILRSVDQLSSPSAKAFPHPIASERLPWAIRYGASSGPLRYPRLPGPTSIPRRRLRGLSRRARDGRP